MQDAENIAQHDDGHEDGAFPDDHLRAQGLHDGERPAAREAQQHQYFENADFHCFTFNNQFDSKRGKDTIFWVWL